MSGARERESSRSLNLTRIYELLRRQRRATRPELARLTGLSRAAVGMFIDDLVCRGLVRCLGVEGHGVGRPPEMLEFNPGATLAIGADLCDNTWRLVAIDLDCQITESCELTLTDRSARAAVQALHAAYDSLRLRLDDRPVLPAIGIGIPGQIDIRSGVVRSAPELAWVDEPIRAMIQESLGVEVLVANRNKVGALAELWHSRDQGKDLIFIFIGTEVSAGIAHGGELYKGQNSNAGEVGHMTVLPDGPLCSCGNRGCLQELVSGPAIERLLRARMSESAETLDGKEVAHESMNVETILKAAEEGDTLARQVVDEVAGYLGIAVANLVNLFNPEMIILGGPVGRRGSVLIEPLEREVSRRARYSLGMVSIASSELGPQSGALGAAVLVLQQAARLLFADA